MAHPLLKAVRSRKALFPKLLLMLLLKVECCTFMENCKWKRLLSFWRLIGLSLACLGICIYAKYQTNLEKRLKLEWSQTPVTVPTGSPPLNQSSVDLAIKIYDIEVPAHVAPVLFDRSVTDRGITIRKLMDDYTEVKVGPPAMASWGLLGSTLAHEIEIHANQNFLWIVLLDLFGFDGTGYAERQAYSYELKNSKRFGLSSAEQKMVAVTKDYYYPQVGAKLSDTRSFRRPQGIAERLFPEYRYFSRKLIVSCQNPNHTH